LHRRTARAGLLALALLALAPAAAPAAPERASIREAGRWLAARQGVNSFALIDSHGGLHGHAGRRAYVAASSVKAMLLVAYLRRVRARGVSAPERRALGAMIERSSNRAATAIYRRVGDGGLRRLAARARLRGFKVHGNWTRAYFGAADGARFMMRFERLTPRRSRRLARKLLASVIPSQRWGAAQAATRAGWTPFFKGGWRRTARGRLVHELALFRRGRERFALAVMTDGNPSHRYGTATLRGVAARLFAR
jgi:hypothetical protein